MSLTETSVAEADLHAFVDGRLTLDRRADILRLLASSQADRSLIEAWQDQNEALRNAFAGIEREPLPASLNLSPLPYLRLTDAPITSAPQPAGSGSSGKLFAALATGAVLIAGFAGAWTLSNASGAVGTVEGSTRVSIDQDLAASALAALDGEAIASRPQGGGGLPTTMIPDLGRAGFGLVRAEMAATAAALVFHYENVGGDKVVISVARAMKSPSSLAPARIGDAWNWHRRDKAYAMAGTMPANRLRSLVSALQGGDGLD